MRNLLLQLFLAAIVGYATARYAVQSTPPPTTPALPPLPPAQQPATPPTTKVPPPATAANAAGAALSVSFRSAVERAAPSVFTVHSARTVSRGPLGLGGTALLAEGLGSGVLIDADGDVVTNHPVVEGANELEVALPDGSVRKTRLVGVDPYSDLALLKIDANGLRPIQLGDLSQVAVGDVVLAIGNPLAVGQTVTQGIISALGR